MGQINVIEILFYFILFFSCWVKAGLSADAIRMGFREGII
jgi:hypothetical protein